MAAIGHCLLGGDFARKEFELKDDPQKGSPPKAVSLAQRARLTLDFELFSRSAPPRKQ